MGWGGRGSHTFCWCLRLWRACTYLFTHTYSTVTWKIFHINILSYLYGEARESALVKFNTLQSSEIPWFALLSDHINLNHERQRPGCDTLITACELSRLMTAGHNNHQKASRSHSIFLLEYCHVISEQFLYFFFLWSSRSSACFLYFIRFFSKSFFFHRVL